MRPCGPFSSPANPTQGAETAQVDMKMVMFLIKLKQSQAEQRQRQATTAPSARNLWAASLCLI